MERLLSPFVTPAAQIKHLPDLRRRRKIAIDPFSDKKKQETMDISLLCSLAVSLHSIRRHFSNWAKPEEKCLKEYFSWKLLFDWMLSNQMLFHIFYILAIYQRMGWNLILF